MQNNHTQNCQGSGCWLQRIVRPPDLTSGFLYDHNEKTIQRNHGRLRLGGGSRGCASPSLVYHHWLQKDRSEKELPLVCVETNMRDGV